MRDEVPAAVRGVAEEQALAQAAAVIKATSRHRSASRSRVRGAAGSVGAAVARTYAREGAKLYLAGPAVRISGRLPDSG